MGEHAVPVRGTPRDAVPAPELAGARIGSERYWSPEFATAEWERLFPKVWLVAGRCDQLRSPGDYVTYDIGRDSVLALQGVDDRIRVFHNVCQHRGNRLVMSETGTLAGAAISCAYHGWRYGTDGRLDWVPDEDDFSGGSPCGVRNLIEVPSDTWAGFIWFSLDPDIAPLRQWLDPVAEHLDVYRMDDMRRTHWVTLEGDFNWKCVQDNFNESYHLPFVHPETVAVMDHHHTGCQFDLYPSGHCRMLMPGGGPGPHFSGRAERTFRAMAQELEFWEIDPEAWRDDLQGLRGELQRRKRAMGADKGYDFTNFSDEQLTDNHHYTVFPNLSFSMKPDGCIWLRATPHATDPEKTIFDLWYLTMFPAGATEYYSNSMGDWVSVDHQAEHQTGSIGEVSCGHAIDQDVAIWRSQHLGLRSRGYRGAYLPAQEARIQYFHENIDRYLAVDPA